MKFFTRDLYDKQQISYKIEHGKPPLEGGEEKIKWINAGKEYVKRLSVIKSMLPESMQKFSEITLHDACVISIDKSEDALTMKLDGTGCPWGPNGHFTLIFKGVKEVDYPQTILNDYWLYEEVDISDKGVFEYSVLFDTSELRVIADDVEFSIRERVNEKEVYELAHEMKNASGLIDASHLSENRKKEITDHIYNLIEGKTDKNFLDLLICMLGKLDAKPRPLIRKLLINTDSRVFGSLLLSGIELNPFAEEIVNYIKENSYTFPESIEQFWEFLSSFIDERKGRDEVILKIIEFILDALQKEESSAQLKQSSLKFILLILEREADVFNKRAVVEQIKMTLSGLPESKDAKIKDLIKKILENLS